MKRLKSDLPVMQDLRRRHVEANREYEDARSTALWDKNDQHDFDEAHDRVFQVEHELQDMLLANVDALLKLATRNMESDR